MVSSPIIDDFPIKQITQLDNCFRRHRILSLGNEAGETWLPVLKCTKKITCGAYSAKFHLFQDIFKLI